MHKSGSQAWVYNLYALLIIHSGLAAELGT